MAKRLGFKQWKVLVSVLTVVAVVIVAPTIASVAFDDRLPCERASAWATLHATELPTTLEDLSELPVDYRRAAFRFLSPEQKAVAWREQLSIAAADPSLSTEQHKWLISTRDFVRAELFASADAFAADNRRLALEAHGLFGFARAKEILATLGPKSPLLPRNRLALGLALDEWIRRSLNVNAMALPDCSCATESSWCGFTGPECGASSQCEHSSSGCGTWWFYPCDGYCGA